MAIVLDAMGSDQYPDPEISASVRAAELFGEEIILVGNQSLLEDKLRQANPKGLPVRIEHAPDVVEMDDKAVAGARSKPLNSMAVGLNLVKQGQASAFVTAGNTGAAMFNAILTLKRMTGVSRPALTAVFPTRKGRVVVLDIGANADCRPDFLVEFAALGSVYADKVLQLPNPRVGLLSNGEEAGKGNQLVKEAYPLLAKSGLNFIGNVEAKELFGGAVDVVVMDGFTGNILLKSSEAVGKLLTDTLKEGLMSSFTTKIGALLAKPAFSALKKMMDPGEIGAAPLLGVNGLVFIGHGRSDANALVNAIGAAHRAVQSDMLSAMNQAVQQILAKE